MRKQQLPVLLLMTVPIVGTTGQAYADTPLFAPPHGMLRVELDQNNQLFSNAGEAGFEDPSNFTATVTGNTILKHNLGGTGILGGIAERDGNLPADAATAASTKLLADDPGFFIGGGAFPPNILVSVNLQNALRYFGPGATEWTAPASGEQLRIFDLTAFDNTGAGDADLVVLMDGDSDGLLGTINLDVTQEAAIPGLPNPGIHAHVGYELNRPDDDQIPAVGAYMMELTLSGREFPAAGGPVLTDSDPIFVVFNNQLSDTDYANAVSAAEALPEPSTVAIIATLGIGLVGLRRRSRLEV